MTHHVQIARAIIKTAKAQRQHEAVIKRMAKLLPSIPRIQNGEGCVSRWQTVAAPTASWGEDAPHLAMGRVPCDLHQL